ncbi:MAG: hypothetical protein EZS28_018495 [Streblomastix strix]|uniref:Uncharacterized protein n=1 Tax=Streblomastix strix TaxID=222440 RepID=A0A5J4VTP1_9EUKA|nr:MAG: hypothetical protein EZS28_018495 [Streblomastix strix]
MVTNSQNQKIEAALDNKELIKDITELFDINDINQNPLFYHIDEKGPESIYKISLDLNIANYEKLVLIDTKFLTFDGIENLLQQQNFEKCSVAHSKANLKNGPTQRITSVQQLDFTIAHSPFLRLVLPVTHLEQIKAELVTALSLGTDNSESRTILRKTRAQAKKQQQLPFDLNNPPPFFVRIKRVQEQKCAVWNMHRCFCKEKCGYNCIV